MPYRGSAPAVTDLVGGQIEIMFDPLQSVLSNVQGGRLRAIALSGSARSAVLPNVPTIAKSGYQDSRRPHGGACSRRPDCRMPGNFAGQRDRPGGAQRRVPRQAESLGVVPTVLSRGDLAEFQRRELAKWGKAVREFGTAMD